MNRSLIGFLILMVIGVWARGSDQNDDGVVLVDNMDMGSSTCNRPSHTAALQKAKKFKVFGPKPGRIFLPRFCLTFP